MEKGKVEEVRGLEGAGRRRKEEEEGEERKEEKVVISLRIAEKNRLKEEREPRGKRREV